MKLSNYFIKLMSNKIIVYLFMTFQVLFLLIPATIAFFPVAFFYFMLFIPNVIKKLMDKSAILGWQNMLPTLIGTDKLGLWLLTTFMISCLAAIIAVWSLLFLAYSGASLKNIPKIIWGGLVAGWIPAIFLSLSGIIDSYKHNNIERLLYYVLIFIGPIISSIIIILWLYIRKQIKIKENLI